ncbi:MAG: glycosyltransferase family 2 protein [Desulfurococcaceae archaeon]
MILEIAALALAGAHFGVPLLYYFYLKRRYLGRPWGIGIDGNYRPKVTVVVPTYNEAELIRDRLDNVYAQDYPRALMEIIVVDSASRDGTAELVRRWASEHGDVDLKLIEEPERRGKSVALNTALRHATGEVVVIADVDARWPSKDTLGEAVKWFSDPRVGAVSCLKEPAGEGPAGVEGGYRQYYNVLRLAESRAWSTPIFHGELAAFRRELLERIGGFPEDIGADDSHTATRIALMGYRAIIPEDVVAVERVPARGYHAWRIRRAQHLLQHFARSLGLARGAPGGFRGFLVAEAYLHLVNPWLLALAAALLLASAAAGSPAAAALLLAGLALLALRPYRAWVAAQAYLLAAALRNLWTKEIAWEKQRK